MYSMDVSSLFTNVPLIETVDYLIEKMEINQYPFTFPLNLLRRLIFKCTMNIPFRFDEEFYVHHDCVAMFLHLAPC